MQVAIIILFLIVQNGCVKFKCYSNVDYAITQANKFCSQADNNKERCEALKIVESVCGIAEKYHNKCMATSNGIQAFIRIHYDECISLDESACRATDYCAWGFNDPFGMKFGDFLPSERDD